MGPKTFMSGFMTGTLVGVAIGVLFASANEETKAELMKGAKKVFGFIKDSALSGVNDMKQPTQKGEGAQPS